MTLIQIGEQIRRNLIALASLTIAIVALTTNSWRAEQSEANRTQRQAAFELLRTLGQLQTTIHYVHFEPGAGRAHPFDGWQAVLLADDYAMVLTDEVKECTGKLRRLWHEHWGELTASGTAEQQLSAQLDLCRQQTRSLLTALD